MKAYIVGGGMDGTIDRAGTYHLITEDGMWLETQWHYSFGSAERSMYESYDSIEIICLGDDDMTLDKLINK